MVKFPKAGHDFQAQRTGQLGQAGRTGATRNVQKKNVRAPVVDTSETVAGERPSLQEQVSQGLARLGAQLYGTDTSAAMQAFQGPGAEVPDSLIALHGNKLARDLGLPADKGQQLARDLALLLVPA